MEDGVAIRRRRECDKCTFRFSTYEEVEILGLSVQKRDGARQAYARDKLERGIRRAFEKRDLPEEEMKKFMTLLEREIQKKAKDNTISSEEIGELLLKQLLKKDKVAYIRFVSVYRKFEDVATFQKELDKLS